MGTLETPPEDEGDLFLYRGDEVSAARPHMQGDVFEGVPGAPEVVMLITHPCSMRAGVELRKELAVVEVVNHQHLPREKWSDGYFDLSPLPGLPIGHAHPVADFRRIRTVPSARLTLDRRVASLSELGVQLLQQRFVHHLTRVAIDLPTLYEHCAPILAEAELQEEWVEAAIGVGIPGTDAAASFQQFLGRGEGSLREALENANTRGQVRRGVRQEIREMRSEARG